MYKGGVVRFDDFISFFLNIPFFPGQIEDFLIGASNLQKGV